VDQQVLLYENNELFTEFSEEEVQQWIELDIPRTTSRFFFFDGEQIQRFADEDAESENLKESIEILLGIDAYRQLRQDIYTFVIRQMGNEPIETLEGEELRIRADLKKIDGDLARVNAEIDQIQGELRELAARERKLKAELENVLSAYDPQQQDQRDQVQSDLARLGIELADVENAARTEIQDNLAYQFLYEPLTMLIEAAEQALQTRQNRELQVLLQNSVRKCAEKLIQRGTCACGAPLHSGGREQLQKELIALFESLITPAVDQTASPVANLVSNPDRIKRFVEDVTVNWRDIRALCDRRQALRDRLTYLDADIRSLTPDPELQKRYAKLDAEKADVMGQQGRRRSDLEKLKRDREQLDEERKKKERDLETALGRLVERRGQIHTKRKAEIIAAMLDELVDRLRKTKLNELESFTTELYNRLQPKGSYRGAIRFNADDYRSVIELPSGEILRKGELSAGEKEIYAISLIGGLCRAAKCPIPIIIDTPLSRLDQDNRRNVVQQYYPRAGEQVILLSTNEEVYGMYYDLLRDAILQQFLLEYDEESKSTRVRANAYF
jgi:DNA sulfur modification protein DndD